MSASRNVAQVTATSCQIAERNKEAQIVVHGAQLELGKVPVWSWLPVEDIEPDTLNQITNLANLPGAAHVAVMPDAHKGYGMPIGCALATTGTVVPYAVGVDIGCGMIAVRTSLDAVDCADGSIEATLRAIYERVPVGQPS